VAYARGLWHTTQPVPFGSELLVWRYGPGWNHQSEEMEVNDGPQESAKCARRAGQA
jgi:hypothetical protein